MEDPVNELPSTEFYELSGFWPAQLQEVVDNLHMIPRRITCSVTCCAASRDVAVFCDAAAVEESRQAAGCFLCCAKRLCLVYKIYRELFSLLVQHYRRLVQVLDYWRIIPL
jgi:hypothetical protein